MTWVATAIIGSGIIGAVASNRASRGQERAAEGAQQLSNEQFNKQTELQEPFRQAGITSQNRLMHLLGIGVDPRSMMGPHRPGSGGDDFGKYGRDFSMDDFQADPGYLFRLSEGTKAMDRSAAARGGLQSGGALKAAQRFGQDAASQEFTNAFNRFQVNRSNQIQPLQSFMSGGQSATNQIGQDRQNFVSNATGAMYGGANARGSGYVGVANQFNNSLGQYLNHQQFNRFMGPGAGKPGGAGYNFYTPPDQFMGPPGP